MWLVILEAMGAGLILVGIVWWTMFSGRRGGERRVDTSDPPPDQQLGQQAGQPPDRPPHQPPAG